MPTYKITDLVPEPFTVIDPSDNKRYDGKMITQFGATEYAKYQRLAAELQTALNTLNGMPITGDNGRCAPTGAEIDAAGAAIDSVVLEILATIVPAMPDARRQALSFGQKMGLLRAWQQAQPEVDPKTPALPGVTRGKRSSA